MEAVFFRVLNMSITACWLMAAVILLRLLLKNAPKWISCMLWAFVAVRLICPLSVESPLSLIPDGEPVVERRTPVGDMPQTVPLRNMDRNETENGNADGAERGADDGAGTYPASGGVANDSRTGVSGGVTRADVFGIVWICGAAVLICYSMISYAKLHKRTAVSIEAAGRVWLCDEIRTPFILGIVRPRIYLPSDLNKAQEEYVIAHEKIHLKRRDHWWKPLGFFILSVHWFNPLCWLSYILFCRDIEQACDERVIQEKDEEYKKSYAEALLACSIGSKVITACPLAFGETSVKERVKNIMNYKKPTLWIVLTAAAACIVVAVCFLTNPQKKQEIEADRQEETGSQDGSRIEVRQDGEEPGTERGGTEDAEEGTFRLDEAGGDGVDDTGGRPDTVGAGTAGEVREQDHVSEDVPNMVYEQAKKYVQAAFDRTKENFEQSSSMANSYKDWRIENLEYSYTYEKIVGMTCEIYRLNYEFLAESPEEVVLAGGMEMTEDGWVVPESPNSNYLVFVKEGDALTYFCGMYENDCGPGDELFTSDLITYCAQIGLFDGNEGFHPDGEELIRRFEEVDVETLHAVPFTQDITGDYTGVGVEVTASDGSVAYAKILCLGELPDQGIRLYGYNDETYWRQGVAVEIGEEISYFDWGYMTPRIAFPKLYWNEGWQQLQITLPIYTGTSFAAEMLIVLQYNKEGVLQQNNFYLEEFSALANAVIDYQFDEESGTLTLIDRRTEEEAGSVRLFGEAVYGIWAGDISEFVLGDTILFRVTPGYLTDAAAPQYENMPSLEFEVEILEDEDGGLSFTLGALHQ